MTVTLRHKCCRPRKLPEFAQCRFFCRRLFIPKNNDLGRWSKVTNSLVFQVIGSILSNQLACTVAHQKTVHATI